VSKPFVKSAIGSFKNLIVHAPREYEQSPPHILKRLILPSAETSKESPKGDQQRTERRPSKDSTQHAKNTSRRILEKANNMARAI